MLIILVGVGCKTTSGEKNLSTQGEKQGKESQVLKKNPIQPMRVPIGTVHLVDKAGKFALIKSSRTTNLEPETKIFTYNSDARLSAELKVSPARKSTYLTADFVEGIPSVGDLVMMIHTHNPPQPSGAENPQSAAQVLE
jgi:hypothetical protein